MKTFQLVVVALFLTVLIYTGVVVSEHGPSFLPAYINVLIQYDWPGQFSLDFGGYLLLSALWIAWRHHARPVGLLLAVLAGIGGLLVFAPYLWIVSRQSEGSITTMLLGRERAARLTGN